jgi:antitoxin (DNA-binding transcriptional repressor) of toxin-antitoxin stability system
MKSLPLAEVQTNFPAIIHEVEQGEEIVISCDEAENKVAVIVPYKAWEKTTQTTLVRELGILRGKGKLEFAPDFAMTDEELIRS